MVVASDPGLGRLQLGLAGAGNVAACMVVGYLLAAALHAGPQGTTVFMLLGSVVAMNGTNAMTDYRIRDLAVTAVFFPVAVGVGLTAGTLLSVNHYASLVGFVLVMFAAVWVRRFGTRFFFYGFMGWMGYFFSSFLGSTLAALPGMLLAVTVASAVVLLLSSTVFRQHPRRTLAAVFRSMSARQRQLARACSELVMADADGQAAERASRAVFHARAAVNETVLMSDSWAAHASALPEGWTASTLRRRLLEVELGLDRITIGARELAVAHADEAIRETALDAFAALADGRQKRAREASAALPELAEGAPRAVRDAAANLQRGFSVLTAVPPTPALSKAVQQNERDFVPAVELSLGQLPGTPSVASGVGPRGGQWNPLTRLRFTTRQAVQASVAGVLAIIVGSLISGQRFYWAVIAAFVAFSGTGTRSDTTRKSVLRVVGTLTGFGAGIIVGHLTGGNTLASLAVIVVSIFCGNYLMRVSYGYMIFFLTIMLSELYAILGQFSDALLLLRLGETAAGAAIGIVVALVVTPVSTRDVLAQTERGVIESVAEVLDGLRERTENPQEANAGEIDQRLLATDNELRRLVLVGEPLTRYQLGENRPRAVRRRLTLVANVVATARSLSDEVRRVTDADPELSGEIGTVADFARAVAAEARELVDAPRAAALAGEVVDTRTLSISLRQPVEAYSTLARLQALLEELA